jgi:hypothetical protein
MVTARVIDTVTGVPVVWCVTDDAAVDAHMLLH